MELVWTKAAIEATAEKPGLAKAEDFRELSL